MYCTKCGSQISDDSSFCANCGAKIGDGNTAAPIQPQPIQQVQSVQQFPQVQPVAVQGQGYTLTISRKKQFASGGKVKVTINGIEQGTLANGEQYTYNVPSQIVDVKIWLNFLFIPLNLRLQLYSDAYIQFVIKGTFIRFINKFVLKEISGAIEIK